MDPEEQRPLLQQPPSREDLSEPPQEDCCNPCKCQVCLCRVPKEPTSGDNCFFVDTKMQLPRIPTSAAASIQDQELYVRKVKRAILVKVHAIVSVGETERNEESVALRCWTQVLSSNLSDQQKKLIEGFVLDAARASMVLGEGTQARHFAPAPATNATAATTHHITFTFHIDGMKCASCVNSLESSINALPGVEEVTVSLLSQSATVRHEPALKKETILECIEAAGFEAKWERPPDPSSVHLAIRGMTCASCVGAVERSLQGKPGISTASVSLLNADARISFDAILIGARDIIEIIENLGYEASVIPEKTGNELLQERQKEESVKLKQKLLWSLVAGVPTLVISMVLTMMLPEHDPVRMWFMQELLPGLDLASLILLTLATPVQLILGASFYRSTWKVIRYRADPNMDTLVCVGTTTAYLASIGAMMYNLSSGHMEMMTFFETSVLLITFIFLGRFLEHHAKQKTTSIMSELLQCKPEKTLLVSLEVGSDWKVLSEEPLDVSLLRAGDIVKVGPQQSIPCDGFVVRGESSVSESMLTGESLPVSKTVESPVYAGTVNLSSMIFVKATQVGGETTLQKIVQLVEQAQNQKAELQRLADRISRYFVGMVLGLSLLTFLVWIIVGLSGMLPPDWLPNKMSPTIFALLFAVSVLVIACPCALGLASPTAVMVGSGLASQQGILIKDGGPAMETATSIDIIVFDKTGTLTKGTPTVVNEAGEERWLREMRSIVSHSGHPLSIALAKHIDGKSLPSGSMLNPSVDTTAPSVETLEEIPGRGMKGSIKGETFHIGSERWLTQDIGASFSNDLKNKVEAWKAIGHSIVVVAHSNRIIYAVSLLDPPRDEARLVIAEIQKRKMATWMLSGDTIQTALTVAKSVGIPAENVIAGVLPAEKSDHIKKLQRTARRVDSWRILFAGLLPRRSCSSIPRASEIKDHAIVAMIGDGANDSIAMMQADLSVAMGGGADLALSSANVLLLKSNLTDVLKMLDISRRTVLQIYINFFWAAIFNLVGIPLAAGVFYPVARWRLDPSFAGLAMAMSSVLVVMGSVSMRASSG